MGPVGKTVDEADLPNMRRLFRVWSIALEPNHECPDSRHNAPTVTAVRKHMRLQVAVHDLRIQVSQSHIRQWSNRIVSKKTSRSAQVPKRLAALELL